MKKLTKLFTAGLFSLSLTACGQTQNTTKKEDGTYTVGILQFVQHPALDAASEGFKEALTEAFGDKVTFDEQNASGETANTSTIANQFVTEGVDLIMANATPALQAAKAATGSIPILGTSVTDYGSALDIDDFSGTVGGNVSGTSDLAPLDQQAKLFKELLPDAKKIGILYCTSETNSVYQAKTIRKYLEDEGYTVKEYTFADSNDVQAVTTTACQDSDALYIPTDNTAANNTELIDNVASASATPIICGEEGITKGCGIATLSINYKDLGYITGQMAVKILKGESDISELEIAYAENVAKEYDADRCAKLGIEVPSDYTAIQ